MRIVTRLLAAAAMLLPGIAHADYRYDFNLTAGPAGQTGNFSLTTSNLLTSSGLIPTSSLTSCNLYASNGSTLACGQNIGFYNDATSLTGGAGDIYDAISFGPGFLGGYLVYFNNGSFAAPGTYTNVTSGISNGGRLTISQFSAAVPEPATWAMMIAGFGLAGFAMRRRQQAATVRFA